MGSLDPHVIVDVTQGETEHEFLQAFLPDRPVTVVPGRRIEAELVMGFLNAVGPHPDHDRLTRAAAAYEEALQFWTPGREITCLEHLYIGIECVTKTVLRKHQQITGKNDEQIAAEWNIDLAGHNGRSKLTSEARRRLVFAGDAECATKAREVSDGFEHGYSDFTQIRKPAREILARTAAHFASGNTRNGRS